ncbi:hypothetical protein OAN22_02435 [Alphaproteobacteria bacterium]|nr:hypothetical protein [Alphaproteobacteria bacterium]
MILLDKNFKEILFIASYFCCFNIITQDLYAAAENPIHDLFPVEHQQKAAPAPFESRLTISTTSIDEHPKSDAEKIDFLMACMQSLSLENQRLMRRIQKVELTPVVLPHYIDGFETHPRQKLCGIFIRRVSSQLTNYLGALKVLESSLLAPAEKKKSPAELALETMKKINDRFVPPPAHEILSAVHTIGEFALKVSDAMDERNAEHEASPIPLPSSFNEVDRISLTMASVFAQYLVDFILNFDNTLFTSTHSTELLADAVFDNIKFHIQQTVEAKKNIIPAQLIKDVMHYYRGDKQLKMPWHRERNHVIGTIGYKPVRAIDILIGSPVSILHDDAWKPCHRSLTYQCPTPNGVLDIKGDDTAYLSSGSRSTPRIYYHAPMTIFTNKNEKTVTRRLPIGLAEFLGFQLPDGVEGFSPLDQRVHMASGFSVAEENRETSLSL